MYSMKDSKSNVELELRILTGIVLEKVSDVNDIDPTYEGASYLPQILMNIRQQ